VGHVVRRRLTLSQRGAAPRPLALFRARHGARSLPSPARRASVAALRARARVCVYAGCVTRTPTYVGRAHFSCFCPLRARLAIARLHQRSARALSLSLSLSRWFFESKKVESKKGRRKRRHRRRHRSPHGCDCDFADWTRCVYVCMVAF